MAPPGPDGGRRVDDQLLPGSTNHAVHFTGCGFMLPFHFGVVAAFMDNDISFTHATAASGGVMAALAILGAADLSLGIRQCFDLRYERATSVGSVRSFVTFYREYYHCFRSKLAQEQMPIEQLRGRLQVRLGAIDHKHGPHCKAISDFESEKDLEDAFMSAAYIPFGTSVLPPFFRGGICVDAGIVDAMSFVTVGAIGNQVCPCLDESVWPTHSAIEAAACACANTDANSSLNKGTRPDSLGSKPVNSTKVLVVTHQVISDKITRENFDGIVVRGRARVVADFWADHKAMKNGFIDGYQAALGHIKGAQYATRLDIERKFDLVFKQQENWKAERGFSKPELWLEFDPIAIVGLIAAIVVMLVAILVNWLMMRQQGV